MNDDFEIFIRPATNEDCEKIQNLVFGVLRDYDLPLDLEGTDTDVGDIETHYLKRGGCFEILEDAEGNLLGSIGLYPLDAETVELRKMYFDKKLRGRGYGKLMLEKMIARARSLSYKKIYLETAKILKEAAHLYEKYGFLPTEEKHTPRCDAAYVLELNSMTSKKIGENFLKKLMIGLIYPAILGNIIYIILTFIFTQDERYTVKFVLLLITAFFYLFDYLYIYFTYDFKWWMFILDLIFVIGLFFTYQNLHFPLNSSKNDIAPPNLFMILICYAVFILLYLIWDSIEKKNSKTSEKSMYKWIVWWEIISLSLLGINIVLQFLAILSSYNKSIVVIWTLIFITIGFGRINWEKYKFWNANELENTSKNAYL
ncbi:MAG TPA: GNAT family N-acetyltransferase [Pyrinomonadaceae bacterium]|jgi:N-acetylglutamate synthase-like GNAT family acetyltransferase